MDAGQVLRTVRAAVFAVVCVLAAALGHIVMSGMRVPTSTLLAALAVTAVGAWCFTGRERRPVAVGGLTVGTQAALHTVFSFGQALSGGGSSSESRMSLSQQWARALLCGPGRARLSGSDAARVARDAGLSRHLREGAAPAMAGHGHHGGGGMAIDRMARMPHPMVPDVMHGTMAGMVAAHLLVALLSAWWLCGGERAAFRLARAAAIRLFAPLVVVFGAVIPDAPPSAGPMRETSRRTARELLLAHCISLRGPPPGPAVG
ncbi:PE-PGRS family protein [Streptomyces botrytidirepellens]|uniref:PE-PGRS family protein n=1 Tax=Streptomyces botrytidirepellens TaxID=2486417 RepID=A0A3M8X2Q8_9ACTN|nr:PE-PGRS family protein [Streptomyces botrytidirepellens]RNG34693.1 PE-PGRS family protein [Streptomyces botrytidirepellens]